MGTSVFVRIFNETGDHVLMVRNKRESMRDVWTLPGGGVGRGESPLWTVHRELQEETGLKAEISPKPIYDKLRGDNKRIIVFEGKNARGILKPVDKDIAEAEWVYWPFLMLDDPQDCQYKGFAVYEDHLSYIQLAATEVVA